MCAGTLAAGKRIGSGLARDARFDGRLFVDEYASRFGTRHDDELFRRRRERPMTQRKDSSSAVLVALIAVVAIGVLFFVAWRFGPGEATPRRLPATCLAG